MLKLCRIPKVEIPESTVDLRMERFNITTYLRYPANLDMILACRHGEPLALPLCRILLELTSKYGKMTY